MNLSSTPRMDRMPACVQHAPDADLVANSIDTPEQLADWFAAQRRRWFKFNKDLGMWMVCVNGAWEQDHYCLTHGAVRAILHRIVLVRDDVRWTRKLLGAGFVESTLKAASTDERLRAANTDFDRNPWLLGTPDGTVDLRTGTLGAPNPDDLISRRTHVVPDPTADCPIWRQFLSEATEGHPGFEDYLHRFAGYCLTGLMTEEIVTFLFGSGGNGKGVFLGTVYRMLGSYAASAPPRCFMQRGQEDHPDWLARLDGARFVSVSELPDGAWKLDLIKAWTGAETPMTARFMASKNFEFTPVGKLVFTGNSKPEISNVDEAIRRRMRLLEFRNAPEVPDLTLKSRLMDELPAILRWAIDGCLRYQAEGLGMPDEVKVATNDYFRAEDVAARVVAEWFEHGKSEYRFLMSDTKSVVQAWMHDAGVDRKVSSQKVNDALHRVPGTAIGFHMGAKAWEGVRLTEHAWKLYHKWSATRGVPNRGKDPKTGCIGWETPS
jgi:putative DNA primase/helicase